jgi:Asp-tRNA(Asn)/Glu-tRNA(Gln) amidotransferase A subunit family amidase
MLRAMASTSVLDPMATPLDPARFDTIDEVDLSSLRVAVSEDLGFANVDDGVRRTFRERVEAMSHLFASCEARDPDMSTASRVFWIIRGVHFLAAHMERFRKHPEMLGANVTANVKAGLAMKPEDIGWAYAENTAIYRRFQGFFEHVDVLICPTAAVPPFPVEQLYCDTINGKKLDTYIQWVDIVAGITLTGHPVVQLPCGLGPTGMPFGLQIVGPRLHSDRRTIAIAAALERFFDGAAGMARPRPDIAALSRI